MMNELDFQKMRGDEYFKALQKEWAKSYEYQCKITELLDKLYEKDNEIYRLKCENSDLKFELKCTKNGAD